MDVYVRTHCCETTCSLLVLYNELNPLDIHNNRPAAPGLETCAGCVPTRRDLFAREVTGERHRWSSRSWTVEELLGWMDGFNGHFERADCLLDLPDAVSANILKLGPLVIRDPLNEIILRHTLYMDDGVR